MLLKARIADDMKAAMRAKDAPRLGAVRLLLAAMKQKEVDERVELTDTDVISIIDKMINTACRATMGAADAMPPLISSYTLAINGQPPCVSRQPCTGQVRFRLLRPP